MNPLLLRILVELCTEGVKVINRIYRAPPVRLRFFMRNLAWIYRVRWFERNFISLFLKGSTGSTAPRWFS